VQRSYRRAQLAAEAIGARVESQAWQQGELQVGIAELDSGLEASHDKVARWLNSWGKKDESKAPRCHQKYRIDEVISMLDDYSGQSSAPNEDDDPALQMWGVGKQI
jgi:predicted transcriptional regulator